MTNPIESNLSAAIKAFCSQEFDPNMPAFVDNELVALGVEPSDDQVLEEMKRNKDASMGFSFAMQLGLAPDIFEEDTLPSDMVAYELFCAFKDWVRYIHRGHKVWLKATERNVESSE